MSDICHELRALQAIACAKDPEGVECILLTNLILDICNGLSAAMFTAERVTHLRNVNNRLRKILPNEYTEANHTSVEETIVERSG